MAVWSLTPFFNELDILEIRLATLASVVDHHVILEADTTHSGEPKPFYFEENKKRFAPWARKITHLKVSLKDAPGLWEREKGQRAALWAGFSGEPDDMVLLSDVDEIPHPDAFANSGPCTLLCRMHVGKLNWRWQTPAHHTHVISRYFPAHMIGTRWANLEEARLEDMEPKGPPGWHLSWMVEPDYKLRSFVHQELVPHADLVGAMHGGKLFPGVIHEEIEWCDVDALPPYVQHNRERFRHMMIEKPA